MTNSNTDLHIYTREIRQDERTSLSVLASLVTPGASVLDLGTGSGALGAYLKANKGCMLDGVTFNQAEADVAQPHYRQMEVADLDTCNLPALFKGQHYDFIICADVLEHLKRPEQVLAACRSLLTPQGQVLISVPNAAYCGLVAELLAGEFKYRDEGLLDSTHLRFFTRRSLVRFLAAEGWCIGSVDTIHRDLPASEFTLAFDILPPAVARYLVAVPDALTYQFIVATQPAAAGIQPVEHVPDGPLAGQALFTSQLFLGDESGYHEDRKLTATGVIGAARQTLIFSLPAGGGRALTRLRLDPADRQGFLHLHALNLLDASGAALWRWSADVDGIDVLQATKHHDMVLQPPWGQAGPVLALMHGDDPWIELPLADTFIQSLLGDAASFEATIGWPMSADYLALAPVVDALNGKVRATADAALAERAQLESKIVQERARVEHVAAEARAQREREISLERICVEQATAGERARVEHAAAEARAQREREISQERIRVEQAAAEARALVHSLEDQQRTLQQKLEWFSNQKQLLESQNGNLQQQHNSTYANLLRLQLEHDALAQHLRWIENSTVFRATRPLVRLKMRLHTLASPPVAKVPTSAAVALPPVTARPSTNRVDVIVPVYRGLKDTHDCITSVLASTCKTPYRLVVINDASPEPEVTEWLRQAARGDKRILLLENEENLGFVGTVNRGMALSNTDDVLLLNSDTVVANDWLDRIRKAAYVSDRVASVTPFSNNATICSYPQFCKGNVLPAGYTTAQLDALFARTNPGAVIDVPTGIGFCMYIRRDSLNALGLFDVETFGKGYGEENDFCRRAAAEGWRNLHSLDTFVLHTGGVSFGDSKSARERDAMETLRRLYPDYEPLVHAFVAQDPARPYRQAVDMARIRATNLPVVLAVVHDRAGGTIRHVAELAIYLQQQAVFLTLKPLTGGNVVLEMSGKNEGFALSFAMPQEMGDLVLALRQLGVQHIHFHHLIGHTAELLQLPALLGVQYDFTAHDFYALCPQITLTDQTNGYCGEHGTAQCHTCLKHSAAPGGLSIETWRAQYGNFVQHARHVLVPSRDAARRFASYFPTADVRLAPHTDITPGQPLPKPAPRLLAANAPLKIAVIGALSPIKGADLLEDVATEAAKRGALVDFHLLGYAYRSLCTQPKAKLSVHGEYDDADLPQLLQRLQPDLVWFPAQWPETYSYTLSACLQLGLPVAAPNLGAFAERLSGRSWSWILPWDAKPAVWLEEFNAIREKHFVTGRSPMPYMVIAPEVGYDALTRPWSYTTDYLRNIAPPASTEALSPAFLAAHQLDRADSLHGTQQRSKRRVLSLIVRLRSAPGLRSIVRAVPLRWQTRLKTWLRA